MKISQILIWLMLISSVTGQIQCSVQEVCYGEQIKDRVIIEYGDVNSVCDDCLCNITIRDSKGKGSIVGDMTYIDSGYYGYQVNQDRFKIGNSYSGYMSCYDAGTYIGSSCIDFKVKQCGATLIPSLTDDSGEGTSTDESIWDRIQRLFNPLNFPVISEDIMRARDFVYNIIIWAVNFSHIMWGYVRDMALGIIELLRNPTGYLTKTIIPTVYGFFSVLIMANFLFFLVVEMFIFCLVIIGALSAPPDKQFFELFTLEFKYHVMMLEFCISFLERMLNAVLGLRGMLVSILTFIWNLIPFV